MKTKQQTAIYPFLQGGGEMGKLTRCFNWGLTPVGEPSEWPQSLRTTVSTILRSKFPMFLWWGEDMIQFYNDAYRPSMGSDGKHPSALGAKGPDTWPEIWPIIFPMLRQVETTGEATWMENQLVPIYRNGQLEDVYWTFSYSSVLDDEGNHGGILVTCMETTKTIIGQRKIEKSQHDLLQLFEESPAAIATISKDNDLVFEYANPFYGVLVGRDPRDIIGKPLLKALPELAEQGFDKLLKEVITTGKAFVASEVSVDILREGKIQTRFVNLVYQPRAEYDGTIGGVLVVATDVTEQVRARKIIEEREEKYRTLFDSMDQGYCTLEIIFEGDRCVDYRYLETNPTFDRHLGISNALGKTIREIAPDIEPKWFDFYGSVALTGNPIRIEEESKAFHKWFEVYAIRIGSAEERKVGVFFTDITDRKASEQQLKNNEALLRTVFDAIQESEAKLRSILNSAPTAMAVFVGPDLIIENPNQLMLQVMAAGPDIEGKSFRQLLSGVVDDDQKFVDLVDTVRITGRPYEAQEVPVLFKAEKMTRYFNISFIPLRNDNGDVYSVLDVSVDVTQQVEARRKLNEKEVALEAALEQVRLSKEAAELGTFDMNLESGAMHWDDRCRILFGINHHQPVTFEKDFVGGLHPDDRERILKVIEQLFIRSLSNGDYDVEYRTIGAQDGVERWVKAKGKVYFDHDDKPVRFIGSVLDITNQVMAIQKIEMLVEERTKELAQANEKLQDINHELKRSNQNLEEFAHAASHDLKEPVRKIRFFTNQLREQLSGHLKEAEIRSFNRIDNSSQRMGNLIDDLLLYSHVTQRPHETEPIDLNEKVQRVLDDLELDIEEKKASIRIVNLPVVKGYRRQLQQLLQNLISNALKYSKPGVQPEITITSEQLQRHGKGYRSISVGDNGIGFEPEYADRIFQMFTRLHGKTEYSGSGVGLSIVKKVVENHNGFIEVDSTPGQGSTFKIFLPE